MKFALHNLRMIFSRFRSNGWVLAELFLVFIVMWFLCDSLGCLKYTFYRPLGYNISHVYQLSMITGGESRDTSLTCGDKYWEILQKLEKEPTVESAFLSYWSLPMSGSNSYTDYAVNDSVGVNVRLIRTTAGYTRVFRMNEDAAHPFDELSADADRNVMLNHGAIAKFREKLPRFSEDIALRRYKDSANNIRQYGEIGPFRTYRYGDDAQWAFIRLDENTVRKDYGSLEWGQIVFRVKEQADGPDYRSNFIKNIAPRLDTDNFFVADVSPYTSQQLQYEVMTGDVDKVNSQSIVVLFLLVNVFLGLIGTFWFRTRRRRAEIALRLSMGSSRKQIFGLLMGEGLLLLALVTIPAMIICYNIGIAEISIGRTELISTWPVKWSFLRFLLGSLAAWLLIALMVAIGIWFPARQSMKIQPAEALHEE
jgi:putative ABC transport system permease protein